MMRLAGSLFAALSIACSSQPSGPGGGGDDSPSVDSGTSVDAPDDPAAVDPEWPADEPIPASFDFPPYANLLDASTVVVSWRTYNATTGIVRLATTPDLANATTIASTTSDGYVHHATLSALVAGGAYYYEVAIDGTTDVRRGVFVVPGRTQWRLLHSGEFHAPSQSSDVLKFADAIRAFRPHVILESGDMVDDGNDLSHWRSYFRTSAPWISNVLLLPAHSNHVNGRDGNNNLLDLFVLPNNERWYTTRYGQAELVSIDSTYSADEDIWTDEVPWIEDVSRLAHDGTDDPTFLVAAWHHPACSSQYRTREAERDWVQSNLVGKLVAGGGVDLILAGHDKYYERSVIDGGIVHVITNIGQVSPEIPGGNHDACTAMKTSRDQQSVAFITFDGNQLSGRVLDETGAEIDTFTIAK